MWKTSRLTDKAQILAYLETDRLYAAYAIGDLEPAMFAECTWVGASEAGPVQALALHYRGLEPPALLLMGETDGLRAILASTPWAGRVYLTCRAEHLAMTHEFYAWDEVESMWRMVLQKPQFRPVDGDCIQLTPAHADELAALYALGGGPAYSASQLEHGVFFGTFIDRHLVAVAGTHLVSPTYGVAGVGNVFTHPEYRGRGYGTAVTSAVLAELLGRGIGDIVLNVNQANQVAIGIYERLGFERYCPFVEGPARALRLAERDQGI